nr:uncharacterized protein LOC104088164 [Nicotiana tomentosiformis]
MVADTLSRKSMGSLAHIALTKRLLANDIQRLEVECIKATQYEDERLCKYRDELLAGKSKDMIVESDSVLRIGDRLCVADVNGLRHAILEEAHKSRYTIHPGSTKIYHDLKQFYWWEVKTTYGGVRYPKIFLNEIVRLHGVPIDGQSERPIQILEDMLIACILEFGGSWDVYLPLAEFTYNNSFQSSIQMALYEALHGRKCRTPIGWFEAAETNLLTAQSRKKSYAYKRRRDLVFTIGDKVFLRVSPMKGMMRFVKRGKFSPRFIGPYEILD